MAEPPFWQALMKSVNFYARFAPSFTRVGYVARGLPFKPVKADYSGQTWLVTGATGGLGKATALRAAAKGATVYAVGRNVKALADLVREARGPGSIVPVTCDLSSMAAVAPAMASASQLYESFIFASSAIMCGCAIKKPNLNPASE